MASGTRVVVNIKGTKKGRSRLFVHVGLKESGTRAVVNIRGLRREELSTCPF